MRPLRGGGGGGGLKGGEISYSENDVILCSITEQPQLLPLYLLIK